MADNLKSALALSVSVLNAEHVISANLSSPWTVAKLAEGQEDSDRLWRLLKEAMIASVAVSVLVGVMLSNDSKAPLWWSRRDRCNLRVDCMGL